MLMYISVSLNKCRCKKYQIKQQKNCFLLPQLHSFFFNAASFLSQDTLLTLTFLLLPHFSN